MSPDSAPNERRNWQPVAIIAIAVVLMANLAAVLWLISRTDRSVGAPVAPQPAEGSQEAVSRLEHLQKSVAELSSKAEKQAPTLESDLAVRLGALQKKIEATVPPPPPKPEPPKFVFKSIAVLPFKTSILDQMDGKSRTESELKNLPRVRKDTATMGPGLGALLKRAGRFQVVTIEETESASGVADLAAAANKANVECVLTGEVFESGSFEPKVAMRMSLIDAESGFAVWSKEFEFRNRLWSADEVPFRNFLSESLTTAVAELTAFAAPKKE